MYWACVLLLIISTFYKRKNILFIISEVTQSGFKINTYKWKKLNIVRKPLLFAHPVDAVTLAFIWSHVCVHPMNLNPTFPLL